LFFEVCLKKVGSRAHFFLLRGREILKFDQLLKEVRQVAEPILQSQGLELVDLEYRREAQGWVLRFYIDREGGVTVEDCAEVSGELGAVLEVRDLIVNPYVLEVSSPGLTRPLKKPEDFNKYRNRLVKVKTSEPIEGRRNFKGVLLGLEDDKVRLEMEGQSYEIPFRGIAKANLEFEF
jgi:ribosome maturation factor RimP